MSASPLQAIFGGTASPLPACCMDFDIALEHLVFPERLPPDGKEFIQCHGIFDVPLSQLIAGAEDRGLDAEGQPTVRIKHRCKQLLDDGRCGIYGGRPKICREFQCSARKDCVCGGKGPAAGGGLIRIIEGLPNAFGSDPQPD